MPNIEIKSRALASHEKSKPRPVRLFKEPGKIKYYIKTNGKKRVVKVPSPHNKSLKLAQKWFNSKHVRATTGIKALAQNIIRITHRRPSSKTIRQRIAPYNSVHLQQLADLYARLLESKASNNTIEYVRHQIDDEIAQAPSQPPPSAPPSQPPPAPPLPPSSRPSQPKPKGKIPREQMSIRDQINEEIKSKGRSLLKPVVINNSFNPDLEEVISDIRNIRESITPKAVPKVPEAKQQEVKVPEETKELSREELVDRNLLPPLPGATPALSTIPPAPPLSSDIPPAPPLSSDIPQAPPLLQQSDNKEELSLNQILDKIGNAAQEAEGEQLIQQTDEPINQPEIDNLLQEEGSINTQLESTRRLEREAEEKNDEETINEAKENEKILLEKKKALEKKKDELYKAYRARSTNGRKKTRDQYFANKYMTDDALKRKYGLGKRIMSLVNQAKSKLPALYDDEIEDFFKNEPRFLGVLSSDQIDELPDKYPKGSGFVMNLDPSNKPGSHWVSVYFGPTEVCYMDSFGQPPSKDFIKRLKKKIDVWQLPILLKLKVNRVQQQDARTNHCGFFAIRNLQELMDGTPFSIATRFDKVTQSGSGKLIIQHLKPIENISGKGENIIKSEFLYI